MGGPIVRSGGGLRPWRSRREARAPLGPATSSRSRGGDQLFRAPSKLPILLSLSSSVSSTVYARLCWAAAAAAGAVSGSRRRSPILLGGAVRDDVVPGAAAARASATRHTTNTRRRPSWPGCRAARDSRDDAQPAARGRTWLRVRFDHPSCPCRAAAVLPRGGLCARRCRAYMYNVLIYDTRCRVRRCRCAVVALSSSRGSSSSQASCGVGFSGIFVDYLLGALIPGRDCWCGCGGEEAGQVDSRERRREDKERGCEFLGGGQPKDAVILESGERRMLADTKYSRA